MLEAIISLRPGTTGGVPGISNRNDKKAGDIMQLRPAGFTWSEFELQYFLVTPFDDAALEYELSVSSKDMIMSPYSRIVEVTDGEGPVIYASPERGAFRIDLTPWEGMDVLDSSVPQTGPTPPPGRDAATFDDLVYDQPQAGDDKAVVMESGGRKGALVSDMVGAYLNVVDHAVYTFGGEVWRHGGAPDVGVTQISLDGVAPSIMGYPEAGDLVEAGLAHARSLGARWVVFGRTTDLPGIVRNCLQRNLMPIRPILGWDESKINSELRVRGIEFETQERTVEGVTFTHSPVR